jgi:hypothetical protein
LVGCQTVGYSSARDPTLVRKWQVTITEVESNYCIYNALGASLVGPLAPCEHRGQRVTFTDDAGAKASIVQPTPSRYQLKAGDHAVYIVDRGQVWVQPTDYPLPPEFAK